MAKQKDLYEEPDHGNDDATAENAMAESINSPDLDASGKPQRKALTSAQQAWSVFEKLRSDQSTRNKTNADIVEVFHGRPPFADNDLEPWQSNINTLFLFGLVSKTVPVLTSYIENAKWLTQSKLKDTSTEGEDKTNRLRDIVTETYRAWPGWRAFCSSLCQELFLIGYTFACRTDEYDWRHKHYRQDKAFTWDGTSQFSGDVQVLGIEQDFLIHELTEIIEDKEVAKAAKWNVENTIDSINHAMPGSDDSSQNPREAEDVIQEGNLGASMSGGAKTVKAAHLFVIETGDKGKVTHVILDRERNHHELLWHESRFEDIQDIVTLFTLNPGNSNFYGAIGLGNITVNYSIIIDAATNNAIDQLRIAGLIPLSVDKGNQLPPPRIKTPFLYVNKEAQFQNKAPMAANITAFVQLINQILKMVEQATQQYMPSAITQAESAIGNKTAREASIDFTREQQSVAAFVGRFAGQLGGMIGAGQRAMFHPDTNDKAAKEARKRALEFVSEEELQEFANSSAVEVLQDLTENESRAKLALANDPELISSPAIDQKKRLEMKISAYPVPSAISRGLIKEDFIDPNDEAEQFRQQQTETNNIMDGDSVPVSGRDNDKVHLDVIMPDLLKGFQGVQQRLTEKPELAQDPETGRSLDHLGTGLKHATAHVTNWQRKGANEQEITPYAEAVKKGEEMLTQLAKKIMEVQGQMAKQQAPEIAPTPTPQPQPEPPEKVTPTDLVKMYVDDGTPDSIKRQIEQQLGLQPAQQEEPAPTILPMEAPPLA